MSRPRQHNKHLPPLMRYRRGRYSYGKNDVALGADLVEALARYRELHGVGGIAKSYTFAEVAAEYVAHGMRHLAPVTRHRYLLQLKREDDGLLRIFGAMPITSIRPVHVRQLLTLRGDSIAGTREKALLSAIINFGRNRGMHDGPNPCQGVRGKKSRRNVYVTDEMLLPVLAKCDRDTADYVETLYRTGADAGVAALWRADNVQDGMLHVQRTKTGARVRIELVGPLAEIVARRLNSRVGNVYLFARADGNPIGLRAFQKRFLAARKLTDQAWWLKDLRAKAASDAENQSAASTLLAHQDEATTAVYRRRVGNVAQPITRKIRGQE